MVKEGRGKDEEGAYRGSSGAVIRAVLSALFAVLLIALLVRVILGVVCGGETGSARQGRGEERRERTLLAVVTVVAGALLFVCGRERGQQG